MNRRLTSSTLFREFAKNISGEFQSLVERAVNRLDQELRKDQDLRASAAIEREESKGWRDHRYAEELRQKVEVIKGTLDHAWTSLREVRQVTVTSD
jgi:ATP-dependent protease HslVU (ClpYQ) peptidase subunit